MLTPQQEAILDRGRRLLELRNVPGYSDVFVISQKIAEEARDQLLRYQGWDKDELFRLQKRADGMLEHHERLLSAIGETVQQVLNYGRDFAPPIEAEQELSEDERDQLQGSFLAGVR